MKFRQVFNILILLICPFTVYSQSYAVKPAWWDSVKINVVKGNDLSDAYRKTTEANYTEKTKLENYVDIKIISEILSGAVSEKEKIPRWFFQKIINDYRLLNDYENMLYWVDLQFKNTSDFAVTKRIFEDYYRNCLNDNKMAVNAEYVFRKIFESKNYDSQIKALAVSYMLDLMLKMNELSELLNFLTDNNTALRDLISNERMFFKLKAQIQKGDSESAAGTVRDMENITEIKDRQEFISLKRSVELMKKDPVQVEMDWEFDSTIENAAKFNAENNTAKLIRLIRNTLISKADSLYETYDRFLLAGAIPKYKDAFKKFDRIYNPSVKNYEDVLQEKSDYTETQLKRRISLLSLNPVKQSEPLSVQKNTVADMNLPEAANLVFQPLITMSFGSLEYLQGQGMFANKTSMFPLVFFSRLEDSYFVQNSRQIACVKDGKILWIRSFKNSTVNSGIYRPELITGSFSPKTNGKMFFSRILMDGRFALLGINPDNGHTVWSCQPKEYLICSEPALYRDQLIVIAKKPDLIARYFLLFVNQLSGKIEDEMFLFSASDATPIMGNSVMLDYFMPEPVIENNRAYLATNFGILYCVDISGNYLIWARKYSRIPFAVSKELSSLLWTRRISPPVAGKQNILFAPVDSSGLLLLNKETGSLVAENGVDWIDVRPDGLDSAVIIDKNQQAGIYSLDRINPVANLPGRNYSFIESLRNGVVLMGNGAVEIWDETGKLSKKIPMPGNFIPQMLSKTGYIGYQKNTMLPAVGTLVAPDKKNNRIPFQTIEKNVSNLENSSIRKVDNRYYIFSSNYLVSLSDKAEVEWSFPVYTEDLAVHRTPNSVFIVSEKNISEVSQKDGTLLRRYPEQGANSVNFTASALSSDKLIFAETSKETGRTSIFQLDEDDAKLKYAFPNYINVKSLYKGGEYLLGVDNRNIDLYKFDPANSSYVKTGKSAVLERHMFEYDFLKIDDNKTAILLPNSCLVSDISSFFKIEGKTFGQRSREWKSDSKVAGKFIICKYFNDAWNIFDWDKKTDLSQNIQIFTEPVIDNEIITGLGKGKKSNKNTTFQAVSFDAKSGKILYDEPVDLASLIPPRWGLRDNFGFTMDGKVYNMLSLIGIKEETEENILVIQDLRRKKVEIKTFPGYKECANAMVLKDKILLLIDNSLRVFTKDEFLKLTEKSSGFFNIAEDPNFKCVADGYPDEWDLSKFYAAGKNSFYSYLVRDDLVFAGVIKDEKLISKIGKSGLEGKLSFVMMPGSVACLRTDNMETSGFSGTLGNIPDPQVKYAYSMSPSGDFCFFEIVIPLKNIFHSRFNINEIKKLVTRDVRGDLAFDFLLKDKDGNTESLFPEKPAACPLYYPRIMFINEKGK